MADRKVKVSLVAEVNGYLDGMDKAAKKTREVGSETEKLAQKKQAFETLGRSAVVAGALIAAGIGVAIARFAQFDQAMSNVQAATQESASNMLLLRDAALQAGSDTVFSAVEAANAIEELGKAGLTTAEILDGGLAGALSLAAAGQLGVAEAAGYTAIALKQFQLDGSNASHVADLFAAGAGKAVGDVDDLAQALNQTGLIAKGAGFSIEETTGVLAAFADAGLLGSDAGTSLTTASIKLQAPTKEAQSQLDKYGISVYDANGQMKSFEGIAGQLESKLGGLDEQTRNAALATIFGTDALRVANVLYEQGADGIKQYVDQTNDAGYAAKVAGDRLDNLVGDVEKLGGAFDTALIKTGSGANEVLRGLVQSATFLVDGLGSLPTPVINAGLAVAALAASVLLAGGAAALAVPKYAEFKAALGVLRIEAGSLAVKVGLAAGAIGIATMVLGAFIAEQAASTARTDAFRDSLDQATGAVTSYTRELVVKKLEEKGAFADAEKYGISQKLLTDAVLNGGDALEQVREKLDAASDGLKGNQLRAAELAATHGATSIAIRTTRGELEDAAKELENSKAAMDGNAQSTQTAAEAYQSAADEAGELNQSLNTLIETIMKANGVGQDAVSQNIAYQDALFGVDEYIRQAREGVEGYALTLDQNTQAGRDNMGMLNGLAADYQSAAEAQFALDGNSKNYVANLQAGRDAVLQRAADLGATDAQIQFLSEHIVAMPNEKEIKIIAETAAAQTRLDEFITLNSGRVIYAHVEGSLRGGFSSGGYTGDIPADQIAGPVHGQEFVVNQAGTAKPANRAAMEYMNAGGDITNYTTARMVSAPSPSSSAGGVSSAAQFSVVVEPRGGIDILKYVDIRVEQRGRDGASSIQNGKK